MKRILSLVLLVMSLVGGGGFSFAESKDEDYKDYVQFNTLNLGELKDVVVAFNPKNAEFIWKDFGTSESSDWTVIATEDLDPILRDLKTKEEVELIVNYPGITPRLRHIGNDVGIAIDYKLKGGGPIAAIACGVVCKIINTCGCIAGTAIVSPLGPIVAAMYLAVCASMDTAGTAGCAAACMALPTP